MQVAQLSSNLMPNFPLVASVNLSCELIDFVMKIKLKVGGNLISRDY